MYVNLIYEFCQLSIGISNIIITRPTRFSTNILQLENYIQVAHLEHQGKEIQYFQLQFVEIEVTDVLIDRNIRFVPSQRNNGVNQNKYTATIEHEKMGTPIQNQAVTYDQNVNNDIMEIDFRRYQLKTGRKSENQEEIHLSHKYNGKV